MANDDLTKVLIGGALVAAGAFLYRAIRSGEAEGSAKGAGRELKGAGKELKGAAKGAAHDAHGALKGASRDVKSALS